MRKRKFRLPTNKTRPPDRANCATQMAVIIVQEKCRPRESVRRRATRFVNITLILMLLLNNKNSRQQVADCAEASSEQPRQEDLGVEQTEEDLLKSTFHDTGEELSRTMGRTPGGDLQQAKGAKDEPLAEPNELWLLPNASMHERRALDDSNFVSALQAPGVNEVPAFGDQPEPSELEHQLVTMPNSVSPSTSSSNSSANQSSLTTPTTSVSGNQFSSLNTNYTASLALEGQQDSNLNATFGVVKVDSGEQLTQLGLKEEQKKKRKKYKKKTSSLSYSRQPTMISYVSNGSPEGSANDLDHGIVRVLQPNELLLRAYQFALNKQQQQQLNDKRFEVHSLAQSLASNEQSQQLYAQPVKLGAAQAETAHPVQVLPALRAVRGPFELDQLQQGRREQQLLWPNLAAAWQPGALSGAGEPLAAATSSKLEQREPGETHTEFNETDMEPEELLEGDEDESKALNSEHKPKGAARQGLPIAAPSSVQVARNETHSEQNVGKQQEAGAEKQFLGLPTRLNGSTVGGVEAASRLATNELLVGPFKSEAEAPATITLAGVVYQKSGASQASLVQRRPLTMQAQQQQTQPAQVAALQQSQPAAQWRPVATGPNIVLGTLRGQQAELPGSSALIAAQLTGGELAMPTGLAWPKQGSGGSQAGEQLSLSASSLSQGASQQQALLAAQSGATQTAARANNNKLQQQAAMFGAMAEQYSVRDLLGQLVASAASQAIAGPPELLSGGGGLTAASAHTLAASEPKAHSGGKSHTPGPIVIVQKDVKPVKYHLLRAYLKLRRLLRPFETTYVFPGASAGAQMAATSASGTSSFIEHSAPGASLLSRRRAWSGRSRAPAGLVGADLHFS